MQKFLAGLAVLGVIVTATPAAAGEWKVQTGKHDTTTITTTSATTADEVRDDLRRVIVAHRAFVHRLKVKRQRAAEAARQAQAAQQQPVFVPSPDPFAYTGGVLSAQQVASYARGAGFPEYVIPTMVSIAYRESRFDPGAVNGGGPAYSGGPACGLWQLYECPGSYATDPAVNAALAYQKFVAAELAGGTGLEPWGG